MPIPIAIALGAYATGLGITSYWLDIWRDVEGNAVDSEMFKRFDGIESSLIDLQALAEAGLVASIAENLGSSDTALTTLQNYLNTEDAS